ncbi:ATP-binding protein [Thermithiobacillus plumbiphilus]|uniref:histidine kinase n=1 Tax=Thermithiobacillus plumbiphilus TaxID=1729899 RepID=A0ABU9D3X6_9PROT
MQIKASILLVDDRPENLLALEASLEGLGHELVRAYSGEEALKYLLKQDFAVILLDVQMPGINGFETARLIKDRPKSRMIPIIFMTAINKDERYIFEGYAMGAVDYMVKPFDPAVLRSKVSVFVDLYVKNEQIRRQGELLRQIERREQARQLAELEEAKELRYRNLAESIPQLVWTALPDRSFGYFNRRWCEYTGLDPEAMGLDVLGSILPPEDLASFDAAWDQALETGQGFELEARLKRDADQLQRWHLIQVLPERGPGDEIIGWLGTCTDIDERVRTRETLRTLNAKLLDQNQRIEAEVQERTRDVIRQKRFIEEVIEHAPGGVAYVDRELVLRLGNPGFVRMTGFAREELLNHPLPETALAEIVEPLREALDQGKRLECAEISFAALDDGPALRCWDFTFFPVPGEAGSEGVLIYSLDVTDRVENARMQREQIEHLHQVDRMKSEFLSVISHELRTPLNYINGFASVLEGQMAGPLNERQRAFLRNIISGSDRMLYLVNDLLDFAKLQSGRFELSLASADFVELVEEVAGMMLPQAEKKGVSLHVEVPWDCNLLCDRRRVVQVLTNLLDNGIKFTPAGGEVKLRCFPDGDFLVTEVRDTGVGIDPEDIGKLFTPFTQLDMSSTREAGGTGLGLCIAKALVQSHGGDIGVESPGRQAGTLFRVRLPLQDAKAVRRSRQKSRQRTGG